MLHHKIFGVIHTLENYTKFTYCCKYGLAVLQLP